MSLHNSASDLSPTSTGLVYFNTTSSLVKWYTGSAWVTAADTTSSQVFTNKDIDGGTASDTSRITLPKASTSTLNGLTRKAGTLVYDTTTGEFKGDNGTALGAFGSQSQATASALGVVKGGTVPGLTSGASVASGYIGEIVTSGTISTTTVGSATYVDVTGASIALSAGIWLIHAYFMLRIDQSGGGAINCGLFDSSNVFQGGNALHKGEDTHKQGKSFTVYKNISSSTTYKLRIASTGTTSSFEVTDQSLTNDGAYAFYAVRIA
jgi:hypothetical protein